MAQERGLPGPDLGVDSPVRAGLKARSREPPPVPAEGIREQERASGLVPQDPVADSLELVLGVDILEQEPVAAVQEWVPSGSVVPDHQPAAELASAYLEQVPSGSVEQDRRPASFVDTDLPVVGLPVAAVRVASEHHQECILASGSEIVVLAPARSGPAVVQVEHR